MPSLDPAPRKPSASLARQLALALELPLVPIAGVLIGGGIGYLLDHWLHTSPTFTLVGGGMGFGGGLWNVLKELSKDSRKQGSGDGQG